MEINIKIHVGPGTARRLAYVGITLLLVGTAALANAVPVTFMPHQKLTAAQLNDNFGDIEKRLASIEETLKAKAEKSELSPITDWVAYDPLLRIDKTETRVRNQTTNGYYRRVGDSLDVRILTSFTGSPGSNAVYWSWSLPPGLAIDFKRCGPISVVTVGSGLAQVTNDSDALAVYARDGNTVSATPSGRSSYYINDKNPFAFDAGATIGLIFTVPIVGWERGQ